LASYGFLGAFLWVFLWAFVDRILVPGKRGQDAGAGYINNSQQHSWRKVDFLHFRGGGAGVGRRHWSVPRYGKGIPLLKLSMLKTGWTFRWLWNSVGFGRYYFFSLPFGSFRLPQTRVCTTTCTSINNCHNNKSKEDFDGDEMKDERINYLPKKAELQICHHMCTVRGQKRESFPLKSQP